MFGSLRPFPTHIWNTNCNEPIRGRGNLLPSNRNQGKGVKPRFTVITVHSDLNKGNRHLLFKICLSSVSRPLIFCTWSAPIVLQRWVQWPEEVAAYGPVWLAIVLYDVYAKPSLIKRGETMFGQRRESWEWTTHSRRFMCWGNQVTHYPKYGMTCSTLGIYARTLC